jgi:hypothetical protein
LQVLSIDAENDFDKSMPFNHYPADYPVLGFCVKVATQNLRPIQAHYQLVTPAQWKLLEKSWDRKPDKRPSMQDILTLLDEVL